MMIALAIVGVAVVGYLLGSMPWSVWIGRWFYDIDVRGYGSGNAGATNTIRVLGILPGLLVFMLDVLKGLLSVLVAWQVGGLLIARGALDESWGVPIQLLGGVCAFLGHVFPIFAGFRGGKGVATLCGVVLGLHPLATLSALGVFALVLLVTRYVSLGSMLAALSFPFFLYFVYGERNPWLIAVSIVLVVMIIVTHRANIGRLLHGKESRFSPSRAGMRNQVKKG
jgi:acyl-phosphate glycerol 3-phosphate acyltransferase